MSAVRAVGHALLLSGSMMWGILWALILGFTLSAIVQAVVRRETITRMMGDDRPTTLAVSAGLGAASSSCSYAAVALARSLFRKGASFTAAMAFEIASTNLVLELGIILTLVIGWQFTLAEFVGGPLMIIIVAVVFRLLLRKRLVEAALRQAEQGLAGSMEGHASMDMSVGGDGSMLHRLASSKGRTAVALIFVMEWAAVIRDIVIGLLIAGAVGAWIPDSFWRSFFLTGHPTLAKVWGPIIGPLVAVASFVCSVGNVPLAGVLWNGGISFGGVVSFLFADLIILPIIVIYAKYYGRRMAAFVTFTFYGAMVMTGFLIELIFAVAHIVPSERTARVRETGITFNYTTVLDILFIVLAGLLVVRFVRNGGPDMLGHMNDSPEVASDEPGSSHHFG